MENLSGLIEQSKIKIFTLGPFNVMNSSYQPIYFGDRAKKTWDLLKYIITFKDKSITNENILEHVLYEEDYNDPSNVIKNSIYRLRKKLQWNSYENFDPIIYHNGGYSLNLKGCVYLDIDHFEKISHQALLYENTEPLRSIKLYKECLNLYKGDYLSEDYCNDWILPLRLYFRQKYLRNSVKLLYLLRTFEEFEEIIKIVNDILIREYYDEDIHYLYMEALLNMGKNQKVIQHYKYISDLFKKKYQIEPDKKIKEIYNLAFKSKSTKNSSLSKSLIDEINLSFNGAYLCELNVFKSMLALEKRRNKRENKKTQIIKIKLLTQEMIDSSSKELQKNFKKSLQLLIELFRSGDVITRSKNDTLLILLASKNNTDIDIVFNRIKKYLEHEKLMDIHIQKITLSEGKTIE